jgi:vitamin B12 transporter
MKNLSTTLRLSALACACALTVASYAQTTPLLKEVVITASSSEQPLADVIPATLVISRQDLELSQAQDLPQALRMLAGIDVAQTGTSGSQTSVFLRGSESRHSLVLVDGVPLNRADFGLASLQFISTDQIERIELVRGNVSAIYGSAAVGGVIAVFTRKASQPSVNVEVGSRGQYKANVHAGLRTDTTQLSVSASTLRAGGFSAKDTSESLGADADKDNNKSSSMALAAEHQLATGHKLSARLLAGRNKTEYDGSGPYDRLDTNTQLAGLRMENTWTSRWKSTLDISDSTERFTDATGYIKEGKNHTTQLRWDNAITLVPGQSLQLGAEHQRIQFDDTPATGYKPRQVNAVRLGYLGQQGALSWQANVRHDNTSDFGSASTYYAGLGYALTPQFKLVGSVTTAFNAPNFIDLAFQDPTQPPLKAERSRSREMGIQYTANGWLARTTIFASQQRERVEFDPTTFFSVNTGRASNKGLEISANGPVGPGLLGFDATFQNPVNDSTGQTLKRRAHNNMAVNYSMEFGAWQLATYLKHSGKKRDTDPVSFDDATNNGNTRVDMSAQYRLSPTLKLHGRIENLANSHRNEVLGFNSQPRTLWAGLNWTMPQK